MESKFDADCLFCRIISGQVPGDIVYQDDQVVAMRDRYPKAPTHVLILSREHIPSLREITEEHSGLMAHIIHTGARLAREFGIAEDGYRLAVNVGAWGGQAIYHIHFHLLGGRPLKWEH